MLPGNDGSRYFSLDVGLRMEHRERATLSPPPAAGEHTLAVLQELGYSQRDVDDLKSDGAI
jgi:crotonobetainyl-CoA:carnitine CoA-transferase CaiB-like acyl-CoA transferase